MSESNKRPRKGASHQEKGKRTRASSEPQKVGDASNGGGHGGTRAGDVGRALRSVYDETLREDVPCEFKDLLGRLS